MHASLCFLFCRVHSLISTRQTWRSEKFFRKDLQNYVTKVMNSESGEKLIHNNSINQSILRRSALGFLWREWCWSWNSSSLATSWEELTHWKRLWCWEGLGAGGEGDDRRWDGWMASLTRWTWVWVNSGSWWWTGRPGVLWFMGSQRLNWTELNSICHRHPLNFIGNLILNCSSVRDSVLVKTEEEFYIFHLFYCYCSSKVDHCCAWEIRESNIGNYNNH